MSELQDIDATDLVEHEMGDFNGGIEDEWYPYNNKTVCICIQLHPFIVCSFISQTFLLDVIDNLPRLRISDSMMKVFLWVLRESGARNVPSFDALRKLQKRLHSQSGIPSKSHQSPQGNLFFINDPRKLIAHVSRGVFLRRKCS